MADYYLMHVGRSKEDGAPGRGSGRYPLGSGKRPYQNKPQEVKARRARRGKDKVSKGRKGKKTEKEKTILTDEQKQDIISRGDVKSAFSNKNQFSNEEIDAVIKRNDKFSSLGKLATQDVVSGRQKLEKLMKNAEFAKNSAETLIGVYNVTARVVNAFADTELPTIKGVDKYADRSKRREEAAKKAKEASDEAKKKAFEAEVKRLDDIVKSGDLDLVLENQKKLTNSQLKEAHDRDGILKRIEALQKKNKGE